MSVLTFYLKTETVCSVNQFNKNEKEALLCCFFTAPKMSYVPKYCVALHYGVNSVPIFIKRIQCFADERSLLCGEELDFRTSAG